MIFVIVRVHDVENGKGRDATDRLQQFGSFFLVNSGIDHENALVPDEEGGICAAIVVRNVAIEAGPDLNWSRAQPS